MKINNDVKLDFSDVLIVPQKSNLESRSEVSLEETFYFDKSQREWTGVPIIAANMSSVGTFSMVDSLFKHKILVALHKHYTVEEWAHYLNTRAVKIRNYIFYTVGIDFEKEINKLALIKELLNDKDWPLMLNCDVPNGYINKFVNSIKEYRKCFPTSVIMAGNVVTQDGAVALNKAGADIIKIGIGGGSVCTTRLQTGCGYPQLSAIFDTRKVYKKTKSYICSDGGCTVPGDIAKAFAAGAGFVMLGGMLAGTDECEGEWTKQGTHFRFYGMSSLDAQEKFNDGLKNYRSAEGKTVEIKRKGSVDDVIKNILGGIRSSCTYVGAKNISELKEKVKFIKVNNQYNKVFD